MSCTDGDGNGPMSGILDRMISISRDINIDIPIKCSKYSCICNNCGLPPQPDKCVFMIDEKEQFPDLDSPSLIGKLYEMGMNHFNRKQRDNESTSAFIK